MKTADVKMGCIVPVMTIELSPEEFADDIESEGTYEKLVEICVDLNNCSWMTVGIEQSISDMGFVDTEFEEKYSDWYAINLIHDSDGRMERVVVLELREKEVS